MAVRHGYGKIAGTDALVFAYDTGDTRNSYKGEPTTNLIPNIGTSTANWTEHGWSGDFVISSDYPNTFELTATNGWHNAKYNFGVSSGGTIYVKFDYKIKSHQTNQYNMFVLNGTHLGSYTTYIGAGTQAWEWQTFEGSFTANADTNLAIGIRGVDSSGLTDVLYIRNLQVEQKSHATPFVNGTRSATQGLLDLTGNRSIDLSNVSFDSNAQMTFDGSNDYAITSNMPAMSSWTAETVIKLDTYTTAQKVILDISLGLRLEINNGVFNSHAGNGSGWVYTALPASTNYSANTYYHVVVTVQGGGYAYLYINGVADNVTTPATFTTPQVPLYIGRYTGNGYNIAGQLPLVKVYNRALTASEVRNNYNQYKGRFNI